MKLLLVEDNARLAERVKHHLKASFLIDIAPTGTIGLEKARETGYNAILLDLTLPDIHGHQVCQQLRKESITTPIIVISGVTECDSRIQLLDSGADDYLVKPFDPRELVARIHAIARRQPSENTRHILAVRDLTIDINRRQVHRAGKLIPLRKKEFDILEYLVSNRGSVVTRAMILNHVWDTGKSAWHNTVDVHIKYLRDKVDRPFSSPPLIKTAYGIGYIVDDAK